MTTTTRKHTQLWLAGTALVGAIFGLARDGAAAPYRNGQQVFGDYNGDGRQELTVWRPSSGTWFTNRIYANQGTSSVQWGQRGDTPVPGDYDFDRKTDPAVFRPSDGKWYIKASTKGNTTITLGGTNSIPVPADYDCDGRTDAGVWDKTTGTWSIALAHWNGDPWKGLPPGVWNRQWGQMGDFPVPGDFDGDGCDDFAVWRPSTGYWYVLFQWKNTSVAQLWGEVNDIPLPFDANGDSKTDFVIWRPSTGTWWELYNGTGSAVTVQWGAPGDVPVPGDYDADGLTDLVVWRPSDQKFYVNNPYTGNFWVQWGIATDVPLGGPVPLLQQALPAPTTPVMPPTMPPPTATTGNAIINIKVQVMDPAPCPGINIGVEGKPNQLNVGAMAQPTLTSNGWFCDYRALFTNVAAGSRKVAANSYPAVCQHINIVAGQTNTYFLQGGNYEPGCTF